MICQNPVLHIVQRGDSLYYLAQHYNTTVESLMEMNPHADPYNLPIGMGLLVCPGGPGAPVPPTPPKPEPVCPSPAQQISLINRMRMAWAQHVAWTRMLLISIAARMPDQSAVAARLMRNPRDIARIFGEYYGMGAENAITALLAEHLQIGAELITAMRDKQMAQAGHLERQWYANADKMAKAFAGLNPYYKEEEMRKMLYTHLALTSKEVKERLDGNWAADIAAYDKVEEEAMSMADAFVDGIMKQTASSQDSGYRMQDSGMYGTEAGYRV